tara:strand:- start:197 stop:1027 length:831 start_codon:yes stop_codon:yes gene_type:complete
MTMVWIRKISNSHCIEENDELSLKEHWKHDFRRGFFILRKELSVRSGLLRLSHLWLVLEPLFLTLVYYLVFSTLRANLNLASLFIGLGIMMGFSRGLASGLNTQLKDGGLKIDRVSSRSVIMGQFLILLSDAVFIISGTSIILFLIYDVNLISILLMMLMSILIVLCSHSLYSTFLPLVILVPDAAKLLRFSGLAVFFGSPVLYPLGMTTGMHRTICLYNPFSYFVEPVRHLAIGSDDVFLLHEEVALFYSFFFSALILLSIRRMEKIRWRTSVWS